ncbi:MAG TPA: hypothetical protein VK911_15560 [Vicinamibacterales bacterium]|nr:hypothetical protein [Vicinamibacterales bacterium]
MTPAGGGTQAAPAAVEAHAAAPTRGEWPGFELHGLVRLRLVGARGRERAIVTAQLGLEERPLSGEPDITIRFVDRLPLPGPICFVGLEAGYSGDAFLVLRGKHKQRALVQVPMDAVGSACEITCERGTPAIPLLVTIVNMTVLAKGGLPVHASAFRHRGRGVLVTGWAKGGKTEALLGFAAHGAEYVGDEWIYLDGDRMRGIPEPIRLWDWHFQQMASCWRQLPSSQRARLLALRGVAAATTRLGRHVPGSARWTDRVLALIDSQRYAHVSPRALFGARSGEVDAPLDDVILVGTRAAREISVAPVDPGTVAELMAISLQEERAPLMSFYRRFRFAFPDRINRFLEAAGEIERERLRHVLRGRDCHVVSHPYPPSIPALYAALRPVIERQAATVEPDARAWSTG